jgi:hypothetical protein
MDQASGSQMEGKAGEAGADDLERWACPAHYILPHVSDVIVVIAVLDMAGTIQARMDGGSASVVQQLAYG